MSVATTYGFAGAYLAISGIHFEIESPFFGCVWLALGIAFLALGVLRNVREVVA